SRRRHTRSKRDWSSDVCSSDLPMKKALDIFAREIAPSGTSWSPGTTMPAGGRPSPSPRILPFSFLLDKGRVPVNVGIEEQRLAVDIPGATGEAAGAPVVPPAAWVDPAGEPLVDVPLVKLAWARSGDKGNLSNI